MPRVLDSMLPQVLRRAGAVVVEGPKAVGKTVTAARVAASAVYLDTDANARTAAELDPALVLAGPTPRLIDEWQVVPGIWNRVRREVDARGSRGQFILTGSAVPADDLTRHSGAGRMARVRLRPMSLFELGRSSGVVSLADLMQGGAARAGDEGLTVPGLVDLLCVGGWPTTLGLAPGDALAAMGDYLGEVIRTDISAVDRVARDPGRVRRLLAAVARSVATPATVSTLAADAGGPDGPLDQRTVADYLQALHRLFVVEDQPAWAPALRSRSRLRSGPKRHLADPVLAVAALGATPGRLLADLNHFGFLFESLVVRDLRVYAAAQGAQVLHYRDNTGLEVDAILELQDGSWAACEVKLGTHQVDAAAAGLKRFVERVDVAKAGRPAFVAVITATGYAYRRPDGVDVIPIATLGP